jgi:hypothetical protein
MMITKSNFRDLLAAPEFSRFDPTGKWIAGEMPFQYPSSILN